MFDDFNLCEISRSGGVNKKSNKRKTHSLGSYRGLTEVLIYVLEIIPSVMYKGTEKWKSGTKNNKRKSVWEKVNLSFWKERNSKNTHTHERERSDKKEKKNG